jgi:hypothetical protein
MAKRVNIKAQRIIVFRKEVVKLCSNLTSYLVVDIGAMVENIERDAHKIFSNFAFKEAIGNWRCCEEVVKQYGKLIQAKFIIIRD